MEIVDLPSPNHGPRVGATAPDLVVLHYTGMPSAAAALARLCSPEAEVSAHYLIEETGQVYRLVPEHRRAWHAGEARWGEVTDVNSHSIGVEIVNPGHDGGLPPYAEAQMEALTSLLLTVKLRWGILAQRVLGHSDVSVGRKLDPGEGFDWARLAAAGLAVISQAEAGDAPEGAPEEVCADAAQRFGYRVPEGPEGQAALIRALQMRLAPEETGGPASALLAARIWDLARRFPVKER